MQCFFVLKNGYIATALERTPFGAMAGSTTGGGGGGGGAGGGGGGEGVSWQKAEVMLYSLHAVSKVSGWGVYCYDSLLLPIAPSVSCSCVDALNTPSSKLPLSPTVSRFLHPV